MAYGNIYIAVGAALLTVAAATLTGLPRSLAGSMMAAFYLFAMHSLNIYLDRDAIQMNDPNRAAFYHRWRFAFTGSSALAIVCS
jgi:4-hydroxy-3-methylbut-2-enyl diphosphate reductase